MPDQKKIEKLGAMIHYGHPDPDSMAEALRATSFLGSVNWMELKRDLDHYRTLKQPAAKLKRWDELCRIWHKVHIEASKCISSNDTGGTSIQ